MFYLAASLLLLAASATADCPPGSIYDSYFNKCYQFVSTPKSFLDAEVYCNSLGGHLAEETNAFENSYIAGVAGGATSKTPNFWIGANLLRSSSWAWMSNTSMGYTNWALGQPNSAYPCAYEKNSDLTWVTLSCNTPLPFMCTISPNAVQPGYCPTQSSPPTSAPTRCLSDGICDNGYTLYSGNGLCYKYNRTYVSFSDAYTTCARDGGMLAKIPSQDVNDFLSALPGLQTFGNDCPFFGLSCTSNTQSSCRWVDGTPLGNYTNFYDMYSGINYCTLVAVVSPRDDQDGKWEEDNGPHAFLCQKASTRPPRLIEHVKRQTETNAKSNNQLWAKTSSTIQQ